MDRALEEGNFGSGPRSIIRNESNANKGAHFAASVEFFTVKSGEKEFKVVSKIQPDNEFTRSIMQSDNQFATEVIMYKEVIPLFELQHLFPVMYYGRAEKNYKEDLILLEDMRVDGYKVTKEKLFLSIEHLKLAVVALGEFHAASLVAKERKGEEFRALVSKLQFKPYADPDDTSIESCMARGVMPHMEKYGDILKPALAAMQDKTFIDIVTKPKEPWGVICHGDFCRNNIMFKYDGERPVAVKFFDLQTSRYSSPALDLSFFLYLNTDKATRDQYWDSLLNDYLTSLKSHLPSDIKIDEQAFYDDFASRAVYGYLHCSFFSPIMMLDEPPNVEDFATQTLEEKIQVMTTMGGEKGTQLIADIVDHLLIKGYIHKFLEFINNTSK